MISAVLLKDAVLAGGANHQSVKTIASRREAQRKRDRQVVGLPCRERSLTGVGNQLFRVEGEFFQKSKRSPIAVMLLLKKYV